jgi:hypothetical protein
MTRRNSKARKRDQIIPIEELVAPTAEQLLHGGYVAKFIMDERGLKAWAHVNEGGEINGRQFKAMHFDRLNKAGVFTSDQYLAGCWYRNAHDRSRYDVPQTTDLLRVSGSSGDSAASSDYTQDIRNRWRAARGAWPDDMVGFMDGLLLRNRWPKMQHRERARTLARICGALDDLAFFLSHRRA